MDQRGAVGIGSKAIAVHISLGQPRLRCSRTEKPPPRLLCTTLRALTERKLCCIKLRGVGAKLWVGLMARWAGQQMNEGARSPVNEGAQSPGWSPRGA